MKARGSRLGRLIVLIAPAALAVSCGRLLDGTWEGEPLAVLEGTLEPAPDHAGGEVALAILWFPRSTLLEPPPRPPGGGMPNLCDGMPVPVRETRETTEHTAWMTEPVRLEPEFPVSFRVPLRAVPPEEAQASVPGKNGEHALVSAGVLVAFVDGDGDGRYRPPSPGDPGDPLVALPISGEEAKTLMFADGSPRLAPDPTLELASGFHVVTSDPRGSVRFGPATTPIALTYPADPNARGPLLASLCSTREVEIELGGPPRGELLCAPDGSAWLSRAVELADGDACRIRVHESAACLAPGVPRPEGWPCGE